MDEVYFYQVYKFIMILEQPYLYYAVKHNELDTMNRDNFRYS